MQNVNNTETKKGTIMK